jgi:hypothetical protein
MVGSLVGVVIVLIVAAGTQERVMVQTSAFWRRMLTNETAQGSLDMLGGTGGGGGTNTSNTFIVGIPGIAYTNGTLYFTNPVVIGDLEVDSTNALTTLSNLIVEGWSLFEGPTTNLSNSYEQSVFATEFISTNGFYSFDHTWLGPTNVVDMRYPEQHYDTYTPCQITGLSNLTNAWTQYTVMSFRNLSATNCNLLLPNGYLMESGESSIVLTNGVDTVLSKRRQISSGDTNGVWRAFYRSP